MTFITLNFCVHQPFRLSNFRSNGELKGDPFKLYFNHGLNKYVLERVADKCYFKTNEILLEHIERFRGESKEFKVSFVITGTFLELCEMFKPEIIESFKQLAKTKRVEFLGSTYYHSLASLFESKEEFVEQVKMHSKKMKEVFGFKPKVFVNTEMMFNNVIAKEVEKMGFKGIFTEGAERILGWRSPNYVYIRKYCFPDDPSPTKRIRVLLRNYRLSDDIGFRFSARDWDQWPLTADKYAAWLNATPGQCINIFVDYETFGEHHWEESGIFWFLRALPYEILKYENLEFATPSEVIRKVEPVGEIDVFEFSTLSWADMERDTSAWLGNRMQQVCFEEVKNLEKIVKRLGDPKLLKIWRLLQTSDHYYYLCTKWWSDGDVHKYFSCFSSPQDGFVNFMNVISDFKARLVAELMKKEFKT